MVESDRQPDTHRAKNLLLQLILEGSPPGLQPHLPYPSTSSPFLLSSQWNACSGRLFGTIRQLSGVVVVSIEKPMLS